MAGTASVEIAPWLNAVQFKKVYEYLFSDEITKKRWAVDTISVWETRCHPFLPNAIEATYVLTSAVIQDILWTNASTLIHHTDLQGIYGSAITRFVTLTAEVKKKKEYSTNSISEVAKSIGIPSFIVDIRNELCHSSRPSLSQLRLAVETALQYLKESYWEKEIISIKNDDKHRLEEKELNTLFKDFIKFHDDTLKSIKTKIIKSDDGTHFTNPEYNGLLKKLENYLKKNAQFFVKILASDGIFIPTDEKLKHIVSDEEYTLFDNEYYADEDEEEEDDEMSDTAGNANDIMQSFQFETKYFPEVPDYCENLWYPVIILLNKYDSVPLFMEVLLKSQGDRTKIGQKLLIAWILKILRLHNLSSFSVKSHWLKKIFRNKGFVPNWLRMLHSAVINPCKFTLIILPLILNNLDLELDVAHRIIGMTSLKLGLVSDKNQRNDFCKLFHTANDLKEGLEYQRKEKQNSKLEQRTKKNIKEIEQSDEIFSLCPDACHRLWPSGCIVNAVKDTDEEDEKEIFEYSSRDLSEVNDTATGFVGSMLFSNKNEEDYEDDQACKMNEEPDFNEIMSEIERRETVLLDKRSG